MSSNLVTPTHPKAALHRKRVLLYGAKRLGCMHLLRCDKTKTLAGFRRLSHYTTVGLFVSSRRSSLPLPDEALGTCTPSGLSAAPSTYQRNNLTNSPINNPRDPHNNHNDQIRKPRRVFRGVIFFAGMLWFHTCSLKYPIGLS